MTRFACRLAFPVVSLPLLLASVSPASAQNSGDTDTKAKTVILRVSLIKPENGVVKPKKTPAQPLSVRPKAAPLPTLSVRPKAVPLSARKKPISKPVAVKKPAPTVPMSANEQAAAVEIVAAGRGRINYGAGVVKAIGLGALAPATLKKSRSQDILDARDAAFNDAVRSLSIAVSQVRVTANTRVANYILQNDDVKLRVDAMLKNAEIIEEKILPKSGVYRVVVQAKLTGPNSVTMALDLKSEPAPRSTSVPLATPAPSPFAPGSPAPSEAEYTSLLVDCRHLKVNACMSPKIYDDQGREVYGTMKISPEYVIETGIAAFPRSRKEALNGPRTGERPLIVRAIGVADSNRFCPIISAHDAERAKKANEASHFFERTAVILLIDPAS